MKNTYKHYIVIILIAAAIAFVQMLPQVQYTGTRFISTINLPTQFAEWKGIDISESLNINVDEARFNFINDAAAYQYFDSTGNSLIFIVLDAGNFHNPKVCFTSSGHDIKELNDTEISLPGHRLKAHTLLTEKEGKRTLSIYWIIIDKDVAHEWIEQKYKQLYFSMFNKKMIGLMVRADIPLKGDRIEEAVTLGKQFFYDLYRSIELQHVDYMFGEKQDT